MNNEKIKYKDPFLGEIELEPVPKSQLLGNNILPMNPEVGFYITVEGLQISQDFFKEEYEQISKSYHSVMKKLDEYYKNSKQK